MVFLEGFGFLVGIGADSLDADRGGVGRRDGRHVRDAVLDGAAADVTVVDFAFPSDRRIDDDKIIKENNINKGDCLYIGDTNVDKESATNVGLPYLLVNYGYRTKEELEKMCPNDTTISSTDELYKKLLKWVNL